MITQPEALRLADALSHHKFEVPGRFALDLEETAAELRRLHAEAEELRGALDEAMWHVKYKELKAVNESDTALLKQALEALEFESSGYCGGEQTERALTALRERLGEKK